MKFSLLIGAALSLGPVAASAQAFGPPATRDVYLDKQGVVRWRDDKGEVTLYGANYVITTASDYRAAGYVHGDRKAMIAEDMAQFARMGWDGIRLTFWGDWESSDSAGNLIDNDHLDLLDWLIAKARERGIYMLFSPIQLYGSNWPDALNDTTQPGFGRHFGKQRMGTDSAAREAQVNYLHQILNHVNRYTHVALKDEPGILFIELVNEPWHHPEDQAGSIRYINALTDAVRATGCRKLIFYNVSQDFAIAPAIKASKAQGVTFGWYPTGLNSGHELEGNYLRGVDDYPDMRSPIMARMPRIVYEFDSPDLRTGTMYPAMARTFRSVGTQFAAMFAYDMLGTASRNLGWQTHYLNLVYTPRKAMSAIIAAAAMHRLPRGQNYGGYPRNTTFGEFHISADSNHAELVSRDAMLYAGSTASKPPAPAELNRIAGLGSSPVVSYDGDGLYFLDRIKTGVWRLEVYPDAEPIADPFEPPSPDKIVTAALPSSRQMTVSLPDLGPTFTAARLTSPIAGRGTAEGGRIQVEPGVFILSAAPVDTAQLPRFVGHLGLSEYHAPPVDSIPLTVTALFASAYSTGHPIELRARVIDRVRPDSVTFFIRPATGFGYRPFPMHSADGYLYSATLPSEAVAEGPHNLVIGVSHGGRYLTFPGGTAARPTDWNFNSQHSWRVTIVPATAPLRLFTPDADVSRLTFTRIGDAGRRGLFSLGTSTTTGQPIVHFELPVDSKGAGLPDYTASLIIRGPIQSRAETITTGSAVQLNVRALGTGTIAYLTLMEDDGTSWSAPIDAGSAWKELSIPLSAFKSAKGVLLPEGFPGEWNYWVGPAEGRGGAGDRPRLQHLERLQISLRPAGATMPTAHAGVEIESVNLEFGAPVAGQ